MAREPIRIDARRYPWVRIMATGADMPIIFRFKDDVVTTSIHDMDVNFETGEVRPASLVFVGKDADD
jgi:hypothetical protein